MKNTKLKQMEELDAKIEKTNYDLSGLESRKKEMEDSKFDKQQNIEKLEEEKRTILAKTDKMNRLEKIIYIAFASKNDLKQVDLLNAKITELRNEKDSIQDKIDIQNKLYADTIKEKDNYIEQRKQLYIENTNVNIQENTIKTTHVQDLAKIHKIAKQYEGSEIMKKLSQTIEKYVDRLLENTGKNEKDVVEKEDDYTTTAKEFEYYTLIETELPQNAEGKMKVEIVENEKGEKVVNNTVDVYYYYQAKTFNIGVEKQITGIVVNGERREISNGKVEKVEIYRKKTEETSVQVEYKIKVRNTGEIAGTTTIEENLPEGMKLANNDGMWEEQDGKLIKVIPEIGAGETKEYTVLLNWEQTGENMGEKANEVKIVETGNVPGFVDNNDKDNTANANVIISVETGELPIGLILALVALVGLETVTLRYALVLTKRQKNK